MGDHGVLWLANNYDRVLPNFHPNFAKSPHNSVIDVYAMKGEDELVQLVFSPLASKMISFNNYKWNTSGINSWDFQWKMENGTLADIPISAGTVGYIDCIDPSQAPGTGTPEIGGLFTWQILEIFQSKSFREIDWVGMDLVEVAPAYDHSEITSQAGACFIWNYLCMLGLEI